MMITVGGSIGSGKSTLARKLAQKYNLTYYSVGDIMRALAKDKGLSILQFSLLAEKDTSIDKELDEKQKELAKGDCIMDSRLGAYILEADFKIWLDASLDTQAERISERDGTSIEDSLEHIARREASETERYRKIYGINIADQSVYDLILNTDKLSKDGMFEKSVEVIESKL